MSIECLVKSKAQEIYLILRVSILKASIWNLSAIVGPYATSSPLGIGQAAVFAFKFLFPWVCKIILIRVWLPRLFGLTAAPPKAWRVANFSADTSSSVVLKAELCPHIADC